MNLTIAHASVYKETCSNYLLVSLGNIRFVIESIEVGARRLSRRQLVPQYGCSWLRMPDHHRHRALPDDRRTRDWRLTVTEKDCALLFCFFLTISALLEYKQKSYITNTGNWWLEAGGLEVPTVLKWCTTHVRSKWTVATRTRMCRKPPSTHPIHECTCT
jgi:hypothetical protein